MEIALSSAKKVFEYYKSLGEKAIEQVGDEYLFKALDDKSNSIAVIVKHMHGNMLSRWTDFLTTDGEKDWRQRDGEFEETLSSREEVLALWHEGWQCLFEAIDSLTIEDMKTTVYIRKIAHSVSEAIMRQQTHYAYHVGQIVYLARLFNEGDWQSLSIPKQK